MLSAWFLSFYLLSPPHQTVFAPSLMMGTLSPSSRGTDQRRSESLYLDTCRSKDKLAQDVQHPPSTTSKVVREGHGNDFSAFLLFYIPPPPPHNASRHAPPRRDGAYDSQFSWRTTGDVTCIPNPPSDFFSHYLSRPLPFFGELSPPCEPPFFLTSVPAPTLGEPNIPCSPSCRLRLFEPVPCFPLNQNSWT